MKTAIRNIILVAALTLGSAVSALASGGVNEGIAPERTEPQIKTGNHSIEITMDEEHGSTAVVYALTGQIVKQIPLHEGTTHIELNPGYYIVRIDGISKRVVVK